MFFSRKPEITNLEAHGKGRPAGGISTVERYQDVGECHACLQALTSQLILRVRYFAPGCVAEDADEAWLERGWEESAYDYLDYGLEMDLSNGATWSVIWSVGADSLRIYPGYLVPQEISKEGLIQVWDVSDRWLAGGQRHLVKVLPVFAWDKRQTSGAILCLTTISLTFHDGSLIVISLHNHDTVSVHLSEQAAREGGAWMRS